MKDVVIYLFIFICNMKDAILGFF